ncbi:MAG: AAA family ATPase, partial [Bacteroidota bacterium]
APWFFSQMGHSQEFDGGLEIDRVAYDLNNLYPADLKRAYFREDLVERLRRVIYQRDNSPLVLVGPEGVGKHTVIHEVVWRHLSALDMGGDQFIEKIWHIDPTRLIAGMSYVGWWQKRLEAILQYLLQRGRRHPEKSSLSDKILIDNPIALLRIGKSSQNDMTLSDVLKPYLEKRQLQVIILATPEEWKLVQEKDRRFSDLFQVLRLVEPDLETAAGMVLQQRHFLEMRHDCEITIQAIDRIFSIQRNYLRQKALPGSVMKMLNQLAVKYKFRSIDAPEVREAFETMSGFNELIFDTGLTFEKDQVREAIAENLVGQDRAVDQLTHLVHQIKAKLTDPRKPLGSFLFIGPTGVGKTQAAKVLCRYLTGSEDQLLRFDMNEYIDAYAVARLIGDYNNPEGQLTSRVRYQPFGVVLLDEIEKAHPKVHDILLQVLDDGRLTDSLGRTVDFSNTIIIMTSNVGAREASSNVGYTKDQQDEAAVYRRAVENYFRPEFVNRIGQIVVFNALQLEHILGIARLQIKELLRRDGFVRRTTILNISTEALEWVARRGFDAKMGGRALKRQIERDLTALSAEQLINTQTDVPLLFDIYLEAQQLVPHITALSFVDPLEEAQLPPMPDESRGRGFYMKLLQRVQQLEDQVRWLEADQEREADDLIVIGNQKGENLNWQHYDFKEKIATVKQRLIEMSLGFRDRHFKEGPAIPLRLKGGTLIPRNAWADKVIRESIKDRLFQKEALQEIAENYRITSPQFNSLETEFLDNFLDVAFLELFAQGFLRGHTDRLTIRFSSYIEGYGRDEIETLLQIYTGLFQSLDIQYSVAKDRRSIEAENHSLYELMAPEAGIHLFYQTHQNPLPILLEIRGEQPPPSPPPPRRVLRIYNGDTLTDLRTGYTNAINITPGEFKLLLYSGKPNFSRVKQNKDKLG